MTQFQSVEEIKAALKRRFFAIFMVTVLGSLAAAVFAFSRPELYESIAVVQIEDAQVSDQLSGSPMRADDTARRVKLIEQRIMARDNVQGLIDTYDLFDDPNLSAPERVFELRESVRIEPILDGVMAFQPGAAPSGVRIIVQLGDPEIAAAVANDLMASVVDVSRERSLTRAREALTLFEEEAARVEAQIAAAEAELAAFKEANVASLPDGLSNLRERIASLRENQLTLEQEIVSLQTRSDRLREADLNRQVQLLEEQKALVEGRIAEAERALEAAPEVERQLGALQRQLVQLQDQFTLVMRRQADAELGQQLETRQQSARFEVLETAVPTQFPVSRDPIKLTIFGAVASLFLGLGTGYLLELMNPAIRSAAQLESRLGVAPVVAIPPIRSRHDIRRRRMIWTLGLLALIGACLAAARAVAMRVSDLTGLEGFLPRRAEY
ncbi:Wzz/FepE/Etk N-terminal domain-containing protein [Litorisediminicola beolgyonensis]|uniref:Wzz/FepE/Etk N-terminal domain-containing protein n=1 Tax=Litorisediminicola beolgyonensis TaxID=1173614 RepID=A0ABW3ZGL4_9RHOB